VGDLLLVCGSLVSIIDLKHLPTIPSLVLTNSEALKLLSAFSLTGRDLLAKDAFKAPTNLAPHQERRRDGLYPVVPSVNSYLTVFVL
jgi:hypothetical protein